MMPPPPTQQPVYLMVVTQRGLQHALKLRPKLPTAHIIAPAKRVRQLPSAHQEGIETYTDSLREALERVFGSARQLVFFLAIGAVIRLVAPHLRSKYHDPGVIAIDEAARFVVPLLSGHVGYANAYAVYIAKLLDAEAVITTASDACQTLHVDILGRELGFQIQASSTHITHVSAALVNGEAIALVQEAGARNWWDHRLPLPANITVYEYLEQVDPNAYAGVLCITRRELTPHLRQTFAKRLVIYRPPVDDPA